MSNSISHAETLTMTTEEFEQFRTLVYRRTHIACPDSQQTLFEHKIHIRLKALRLSSFQEYYAALMAPISGDAEFANLIDVIAIHETSFFRIPDHFQGLQYQVFPALLRQRRSPIMVWSAGCASGEEPYSIAMAWLETLRQAHPSNDSHTPIQILATDVSQRIIDLARTGSYAPQKVQKIPQAFLDKYFEDQHTQYQVTPQAKNLIRFEVFNLIDIATPPVTVVDVIFCRNVLIYFDRAAQIRLITELAHLLNAGGYLFLGDAESLHTFPQIAERFENLESGNAIIYQKRGVPSS